MKVGVLALQGDVAEHIRMLGPGACEVRTPAQLDDVDALVLPGGESTTLTKLLRFSELTAPLADRINTGMPVLGTCAGLILLASEVIGGGDVSPFAALDITVERNAYGPQVESFESTVDVAGLGELEVAFIRAPVITRTGPGVEVLASTNGAPVLVRQKNAVGCSFHPEICGDAKLHQWFVASIG